jgi:isopentenyl diphosphate isomerase/L-lactate dehydrogenase-like FMN-dependent dehydrogenase
MHGTIPILGHKHALPFFLTSCAGQRMFHADDNIAEIRHAVGNDVEAHVLKRCRAIIVSKETY